jgi:hypothetical protein
MENQELSNQWFYHLSRHVKPYTNCGRTRCPENIPLVLMYHDHDQSRATRGASFQLRELRTHNS